MENRPVAVAGYAAIAVIAVAVVVGCLVVLLRDPSGTKGSGLSKRFAYDMQSHRQVDPALVGYRQTAAFPVELRQARRLTIGPDGRIFVAGDRTILVLASDGTKQRSIALNDEPRALTIADEPSPGGLLYIAMKSHVEAFDLSGTRVASWKDFGAEAVLTSVAAVDHEVFVADAGNRVVYRCDAKGTVVGRLARRDESRQIPGLVVPSPYCDVAPSADGLLRVANPGMHRIEGYTHDGHLETHWGEAGNRIDAFCGCCNPVRFAILPDGRFVTAEKGIPRVKVYSADGRFECVVAGPETLAPGETILEETREEHRLPVVDVAVDREGRIFVLDPGAAKIRRFEPKPGFAPASRKEAR